MKEGWEDKKNDWLTGSSLLFCIEKWNALCVVEWGMGGMGGGREIPSLL